MSRRLALFLLLVLCAGAFSFLGRTTFTMFHMVDAPEDYGRWPVGVSPRDLRIFRVGDSAKDSGFQRGDLVVEVAGIPVRGADDLRDALEGARAGDIREMTVERNGQRLKARLKLEGGMPGPARGGERLFLLVNGVAILCFCYLLGAFVAFRRPTDPMAWLLLLLLLGFGHIAGGEAGNVRQWDEPWSSLGLFYVTFVSSTWPAWLLWFMMDFPEPGEGKRIFPWAKWPLIIVVVAMGLAHAVTESWSQLDALGAAAFGHLTDWYGPWSFWVISASMTLMFMNLGIKTGTEKKPDAKRRLKLLMWGAIVSLTPFFILLISTRGWRGFGFGRLSVWLWAPPIFLLSILPLTLAYLILVDRAMDVGVAIRQGLRYALATRGVVIARTVLIALLILWTFQVGVSEKLNELERWGIIAALAALILLVRRLADRLRVWLDRVFFREEVKAEHLLLELSEQVRKILDRQTLVDTVASRIGEAMHVQTVKIALNGAKTEGYELALPLQSGDERFGYLLLGPKKSEEPYTRSDRQLLESVAAQTALALDNQRLTERVASEAAQRERLHRELEIAQEVQEQLLPNWALDVPGVEIAGRCRPAQTVGGDGYDYFALPDGSVCFAVSDVVGKGIPAALGMAGVNASLRGLQAAGVREPADLMERLNPLVYGSMSRNRFATMFYGRYEPSRRRLSYTSAGHNPAVLVQASGTEVLKERGLALGFVANTTYPGGEAQLSPGDCVVVYSDGISEAFNPQMEEFGEDRLIETLRGLAGRTPAEIIDRVFSAVDTFAAGAPQHDDMTLLVLRARDPLEPGHPDTV